MGLTKKLFNAIKESLTLPELTPITKEDIFMELDDREFYMDDEEPIDHSYDYENDYTHDYDDR